MKCPECNGCLNSVWIGNRHFWFCDFCETYYILVNKEKVMVDPYETDTDGQTEPD